MFSNTASSAYHFHRTISLTCLWCQNNIGLPTNRLQLVLNFGARAVTKTPKLHHTFSILKPLYWLSKLIQEFNIKSFLSHTKHSIRAIKPTYTLIYERISQHNECLGLATSRCYNITTCTHKKSFHQLKYHDIHRSFFWVCGCVGALMAAKKPS